MNYEPKKDKIFKKAIRGRQLSEDTIHSYSVAVRVFHKATGKTLEEAYNIIKSEEKDKIQNGFLIRYNPNDSSIREYIEELQEYLIKTGKSKSTQNNYQKRIRTLFSGLELILPKPIKIKEDRKKLNVLRKKDIRYILGISNIFHKSIYCFQASTGIRIGDSLKFTIDDWVDATFDYHKCSTIEELLEKNLDANWFGYWEFQPKKTKSSSGVTCQVCNTPESNRYILESIKQRIKKIDAQNQRRKTNIKLEGTDPLFPSNKNYFKQPLTREALVQQNKYKNTRLKEQIIKEINENYDDRKITKKEYEKRLENIPKWHTHSLRHFFITTTRAFLSNRDVGLIMEAHNSDIATDVNYIGESDGVFDKKMIKEYYIGISDKLTFTYTLDPEEFLRLKESERKYKEQVKINKELTKKVDNINDTINIIDNMLNKKSVIDKLNIGE